MINSVIVPPSLPGDLDPRHPLALLRPNKQRRVAVVCDLVEENWPSMDLVAEKLLAHLQRDHSGSVTATRICPPMARRFTSRRTASGSRFNADRFLNRFWDYPRVARRIRTEFDLFHIVDHSYGQLLHELPPERTIVTCHDLDTFQCLLEPTQEPRSVFFRKMMGRTLSGFRRAARVACPSVATRDQLLRYELVAPERVVVVPNGTHPSCSPNAAASADGKAAQLLGSLEVGGVEILHVGSTIPRKRIDLLLQVFAAVRQEFPAARLVRAGGPFTLEQLGLASKLDLARSIVILPHLERDVLAAVYRRASLVLLPSEREGFGLPLIEAMACGTPVVASDLPVLREVGGEAASYVSSAQAPAWAEAVIDLLREREQETASWSDRRAGGIKQAAKFGWADYADKMVGLYQDVLGLDGWPATPRRNEPR